MREISIIIGCLLIDNQCLLFRFIRFIGCFDSTANEGVYIREIIRSPLGAEDLPQALLLPPPPSHREKSVNQRPKNCCYTVR